MAHSADLKFAFVGVEEMEVWEQPCVTAPANVLQYFSSSKRSHWEHHRVDLKVFVPVNDNANGIMIKKVYIQLFPNRLMGDVSQCEASSDASVLDCLFTSLKLVF